MAKDMSSAIPIDFGNQLPEGRKKCSKCGRLFKPDPEAQATMVVCPQCSGKVPRSPRRVYVKNGRISCPEADCGASYPVQPTPEPQMGCCPKCGSQFLIVTPEQEQMADPQPAARSEKLLPQVKNLLTSTVMLDRTGTAMMPSSASAVGESLPRIPMVEGKVHCPGCNTAYPVTPNLSGKYAECSECQRRFIIGE